MLHLEDGVSISMTFTAGSGIILIRRRQKHSKLLTNICLLAAMVFLGRMSQLVLMTSHGFLEIWRAFEVNVLLSGHTGAWYVGTRDVPILQEFHQIVLNPNKIGRIYWRYNKKHFPRFKKKELMKLLSDHHLFLAFLSSCLLTNAEGAL